MLARSEVRYSGMFSFSPYAAPDRRAQQPLALVVAHRFSSERLFDSTDTFEHVVDAQQRGARGYLENPRRLGLDLFAYQRMEPFAGGKINLDTEALLKQSLGRHQIQGIESPARVIVD